MMLNANAQPRAVRCFTGATILYFVKYLKCYYTGIKSLRVLGEAKNVEGRKLGVLHKIYLQYSTTKYEYQAYHSLISYRFLVRFHLSFILSIITISVVHVLR